MVLGFNFLFFSAEEISNCLYSKSVVDVTFSGDFGVASRVTDEGLKDGVLFLSSDSSVSNWAGAD